MDELSTRFMNESIKPKVGIMINSVIRMNIRDYLLGGEKLFCNGVPTSNKTRFIEV